MVPLAPVPVVNRAPGGRGSRLVRREARRPLRTRVALWLVLAFGMFVGVIAAGEFSSLVRVHGFDVTGAETMSSDDISVHAAEGYGGRFLGRNYEIRSLLSFDTGKAREAILGAFPQISDAVVSRDWPHRVAVRVVEREPLGVWCRGTDTEPECSNFDGHAVWGRGVPSTGTLLLTVIDRHPEGTPGDGRVEDILMLFRSLGESGLRVTRVVLPAGPLDEIHLFTTDGYPVYFSTQTELAEQVDVLKVFMADRRARGEFTPQFVDVRVPGKVYFK